MKSKNTREDTGQPARVAQVWHALAAESVLQIIGSRLEGLTPAEVSRRRADYGPNILTKATGDSPWLMFWRQINNPIGWLLVAAGSLALVLHKSTDAIVVLGALVVNAIIGFFQEYRAGKAIEALSAMVPELATGRRGGHVVNIHASELVPGDIVTLQSGDKIPADLRLIQVKNLLVEEAALTGESLPVGKQTGITTPESSLGDRLGMAYSGTLVLQGTATGVVVATGSQTELGHINTLLNETSEIETPLTRQLAKVSLWITAAVVILAGVLLGFGLWIKQAPLTDSLMVAITLAVAAIPEGLPAMITISLALGVRSMAARHAVVRHLPAVETLGSTSVICTDKTGTLTRNEMTVQVAWAGNREYRFSGVGYFPDGVISTNGIDIEGDLPPELREILEISLLCNDATLRRQNEVWGITGDPTEAALVVAGQKSGLDARTLRHEHPRLDVIPFESESKFMATLNVLGGRPQISIKGAPETVLQRCSLGESELGRIHAIIETYARQGMRVIALAKKDAPAAKVITHDDVAGGLAFAGLIGMMDPPRTEAIDAIRVCHGAGITVKMITGDHPTTAQAIGRQLGLLTPSQKAIVGRVLDGLPDAELQALVMETNVFARVAPEHKIRIVEALQAKQHVVAMTGDGVNDGPALKKADIGVAMGITGTAVAKEAAKVILADDNFASIAAAVEEGRRVYDNLIKSLAFLLPTNLGLAFILASAMFFFPVVLIDGKPALLLAMSPTQTLWINLVASLALSVPLAFEVLERNAMRRKPRSPDEPVFSGFIVFRLLMVAGLMTAGSCGLFLWEYTLMAGPAPVTAARHALALSGAQSTCVTTIVFFQVFYLFNCRSLKNSVLSMGMFSNPSVFAGIGVLLLLQSAFLYLPPLQSLFKTAPIGWSEWSHAMLVGASVLPVISAEKWIRGKIEARRMTPPATQGEP
jgi:magnesium-transporting ATPase (P-type)